MVGAAAIVETARAKINLTLHILGRRADGFHELVSVVAFANVGDVVTLTPAPEPHVTVSGPFALDIVGPNLAETALEAARAADRTLLTGHVHIEKLLPIASGIGGGSADAAAVLRALIRLNGDASRSVAWSDIAASLGSDVPACLESSTLLMRSRGERIEPIGLPPLWAVLVTPRLAVPSAKTALVYHALAAAPLAGEPDPDAAGAWPTSRQAWLETMRRIGNDLETPAVKVMPPIARVLSRLRTHAGVEHAQLSGSGPTCFAIAPDESTAEAVAGELRHIQPDWWVTASRLG